MRVHYFQHVSYEKPAFISDWCLAHCYCLSGTHFYEGNFDEPDFEQMDLLVIMGGPMNIYEESDYPWLKQEKEWIERAIKANIPVLGICLGAQLLADRLGAKVYPGKEKEIGWFPIIIMNEIDSPFVGMPEQMTVFHWHGDTFDLPKEASPIAFSKVCKNQAFLYGKQVMGLQFHLEVGEANIREIIEHSQNELTCGRYVQSIPEMCGHLELIQENKAVLFGFLDRWMEQLTTNKI